MNHEQRILRLEIHQEQTEKFHRVIRNSLRIAILIIIIQILIIGEISRPELIENITKTGIIQKMMTLGSW